MRTLLVKAAPIRWPGRLLLATALLAQPASGQNQELTFSFGGIPGQTRNFQGSVGTAQISSDRSFGINYGHRFLDAKIAALYGEIEFVAVPNRSVTAAAATVPQNYASLYLAPGVRLKFFPSSRLSPWGAIGGGYALYQQSAKLSNGQNETDKFLNRGVFDYGGGLDFRLFRFLGLRAEVPIWQSRPERRVEFEYPAQHRGKRRPHFALLRRFLMTTS